MYIDSHRNNTYWLVEKYGVLPVSLCIIRWLSKYTCMVKSLLLVKQFKWLLHMGSMHICISCKYNWISIQYCMIISKLHTIPIQCIKGPATSDKYLMILPLSIPIQAIVMCKYLQASLLVKKKKFSYTSYCFDPNCWANGLTFNGRW